VSCSFVPECAAEPIILRSSCFDGNLLSSGYFNLPPNASDPDYGNTRSGSGGSGVFFGGTAGIQGRVVVLVDINECATDNGGCRQKKCVNSFGSFSCEDSICSTSPCDLNTQTCYDNSTAPTCCPLGYTGQDCSTVALACLSSPCKNGGSWYALWDGSSCSCLFICLFSFFDSVASGAGFACICAGFSGCRCQHDIDECTSSPCKYSPSSPPPL
jgi:Notch-like protein